MRRNAYKDGTRATLRRVAKWLREQRQQIGAQTPDQRATLDELVRQASDQSVEGIFHSGKGMSPEEAALWAWKAGYIAAPSVSALLEGLKNSLDRRKENGT